MGRSCGRGHACMYVCRLIEGEGEAQRRILDRRDPTEKRDCDNKWGTRALIDDDSCDVMEKVRPEHGTDSVSHCVNVK
uniref:Uncharacterized protein n=1 Tax=Panagrellus redivivus TaxID=6233 RepID=A0A7E4UX92_PANRE